MWRGDQPRILMITAASRRHRYAAARLASQLNLVGIVSEDKPGQPATGGGDVNRDEMSEQDLADIRRHFAERDAVEDSVFRLDVGLSDVWPDVWLLQVGAGEVNSRETFDKVSQLAPDLIVLYGSSIIKPPLLAAWDGRMINLHLGLSPYYRGSGTNFWPLVNRQPELVGATLHLATLKVDGGAILAQVRPEARATDRAHDLGVRTIMAGLDALPSVVTAVADGRVTPQAQDESIGRVFRQRDFNAAALRTMWRHFDTGMMEEYQRQCRHL